MPAEIVADLAHGFHRLVVHFRAGLNARAANLHTVLGRHFQQRFRHRAPARVLDTNEQNFHAIADFANGARLPCAQRAQRTRPVLLRDLLDRHTPE